jgi:hypothetical protein
MSSGWRGLCAALIVVVATPLAGQTPPIPPQPDLGPVFAALQAVIQNGDVEGYVRLAAPSADGPGALAFARSLFGSGRATRVSVVQRDRVPRSFGAGTQGFRLAADILIERGARSDIYTCQFDVVPPDAGTPSLPWRIQAAERLSSVEGLERLSIDQTLQYRARNFSVRAEDVEWRLTDGRVFVARSGDRITAAVLMGDGEMTFTPSSAVERGQVRIFAGSETLQSKFDAAYIRFAPSDAERVLDLSALVAEPVDRRLADRAAAVFATEADKSYTIDLGDLSTDRWWVQPTAGDLVAEIRTRRFGTLTYARSLKDHEDVTLFDRQRRRHIAVYASPDKLVARGRFYDENDSREFDVVHYDIDAAVLPDRQWIEGHTTLSIKVLADDLPRLTLRLADALAVESVWTSQHGRVLGLRVRNHNTLLVALPKPAIRGTTLDVVVSYKGKVAPQAPERDTRIASVTPPAETDDNPQMPLEASYLYSNRSYWYPQAPEEGYSTARITLHMPADYGCVASGELVGGSPLVAGVVGQTGASAARRTYTFEAEQPVKYLAFVASRFTRVTGNQAEPAMRLSAEVTGRFRVEAPKIMSQAADIARFYEEIAGARPYPSFALALVEDDLPGGHSPAYFAVLHKVGRAGRQNLTWSADPASFSDYPEYFLAHELAHQWWGQGVGTKNYHEQWISEGFAQYFAALYAERSRGIDAYRAIIRQFRKSTMDRSADGPIYLGARLGHIQGDSRIFRALVYNKGALVLHMLRLLVGDDTFFRSMRRFYHEFQFKQAGSDDVRRVFEAESGRPLQRFFEGWVYGETLPTLAITTKVEVSAGGSAVTIRAEQGALLFDMPVTVTLELADGTTQTVVFSLRDRVTEHRVVVGQTVKRALVVDGDLAATLRL